MNTIIRPIEDKDLIRTDADGEVGFVPLQSIHKKYQSPKEKFMQLVYKEEVKAHETLFEVNGVKFPTPFAANALRIEVDEILKRLEEKYVRLGFKGIKITEYPKVDFSKFSNLDNFELVSEKDVFDEQLTKLYQMTPIYFKSRVYQFKNPDGTLQPTVYRVMENKSSAVKRAKREARSLSKDIDELAKQKEDSKEIETKE